ncbi:sorbosone dehydrogenase family protein [Sphingomonas sp. CL5.1]|uniref:PQQ-dependent sugar dehydrogenase n=1 Tax=Sphingomonas sp. CL5.1 TaxID=2653203 RepID=UPI001584037C|nr:sorbosone dehydrogenase family protein [Sphingomonas sp. CL5.1]QKS00932.1 sorbosone dehydrogenase family protein [Sphingomonas sp. CL5.1]
MRRHILIVSGLVVLAAIAIIAWIAWPDTARLDIARVEGQRPEITDPRAQWIPTMNVAKAVGWQGDAKPVAAAGLTVAAYATGLEHPRWLYRLPNGDVLVAESNSPPREAGGIANKVMGFLMGRAGAGVPSANRITLLRDANGDGVPEVKTVFMTGLNSPSGMALFDGQLYIANTDALVRVPYTEGMTKVTARPELVIKLRGGGNHWARNVIPAEDGKTLYVSVGSSTNIADNGLAAERYRANILQVWPKEKTYRIYAAGLRNPNGMALEPHSHELWTVVNERDMIGSDLAPDYLTAVEMGDHFGWPWYYWGGYPDRRVEPGNAPLQQYSKRPDYALGPHVAALGLTFAEDARLGPEFANGAFIGEHGSWNRKPLSGYKVVFVPFGDTGWPVKDAKPIDVLTGFLNKDGEAQGRPVGVIIDRTGALLVADDVGNRVWRVSAK